MLWNNVITPYPLSGVTTPTTSRVHRTFMDTRTGSEMPIPAPDVTRIASFDDGWGTNSEKYPPLPCLYGKFTRALTFENVHHGAVPST
jgi:hypothetical protein